MNTSETRRTRAWLIIGVVALALWLAEISRAETWEHHTNLPAGWANDDISSLDHDPVTNQLMLVTQGGRIGAFQASPGTVAELLAGSGSPLWAIHCALWRCVATGLDRVLYDIGSGWETAVDTTGNGNQYLPGMGRGEWIYYGYLGVGLAFDFLCSESLSAALGSCRMVSGGPVVALIPVEGSDEVVAFTKPGGVIKYTADLTTETELVPPPVDPMEVRIVRKVKDEYWALVVEELDKCYIKSLNEFAGQWQTRFQVPFGGDPLSFTFDPDGVTPWHGWMTHSLTVVGSDGYGGGKIVSTINGGSTWETGVVDPAANYPYWDVYPAWTSSTEPPLIVVGGENGTILSRPARSSLFFDGFESGDTNSWSATVP